MERQFADIRMIHGDCLEVMPAMADSSVDMVLADLPYGCLNRGNEHASWDCEIDLDALWTELLRVAKPNAAIVMFGQGLFSARLMLSRPKLYRYSLVWDKVRTTGFLNSKKMPLRRHEDVLVFYRSLPVYNPQMTEVEYEKRTHSSRGRKSTNRNTCYGKIGDSAQDGKSCLKYPTSILRFQKKHRDWVHPTEKDVPLLEYLIHTYSNKGDTVLDCTMGSGSTMVACVNTGRKGIGIELMDGYFGIAVRRVAEAESHLKFDF